MKKLVLMLVMILVAMVGRTQSFEGVIHFNMTMNITDPKIKAQIEEARKKENDPATQAKLKEMQAKLDDPKMKEMMQQNPQIKAQMEQMMKAIIGSDPTAMMPKGVTLKFKGTSSVMSMEGGIMDKNEILRIGDKDLTYMVNNAAKTYMVMKNNNSNVPQKTPKITKTSETQKIAGYTCTKYIIEQSGFDGKPLNTNYWATNEIKGIDLKALAKQAGSQNQTLIFTEIDGVPLKTEVLTPQGTMVMECTEVKKESLPASTFALPAGYSESKL
ncbi:MAG: DUF4412 domain-containing protein [Bacteroidota bacterium]